MKRKITVQHEGKSIEVEVDGLIPETDVETGYVVKSKVDQLVKETKAKATRIALAGALTDEEFKTRALGQWGIDPTAKGGTGSNGKLTDEQVAELKKGWERSALQPLLDENGVLKGRLTKVQERVLHKSIVAAARAAGVREEFLQPMPGSTVPAIVAMTTQAFGLHEEDGEFYVRKGDTFEVSPANGSGLYATVDDHFGTMAKNKEYGRFFNKQGQTVGGGTPSTATGAADEGSVIANDPATIGRNLAAVASGKVKVAGHQ